MALINVVVGATQKLGQHDGPLTVDHFISDVAAGIAPCTTLFGLVSFAVTVLGFLLLTFPEVLSSIWIIHDYLRSKRQRRR